MPELPDIEAYLHCLRRRVDGRTLVRVRVHGPSLLRSVDPDVDALRGRRVERISRLGKRIVIGLDGDVALVLHLMIAGRLRWSDGAPSGPPARPSSATSAEFAFDSGTLSLVEQATHKRATLHATAGAAALAAHDPGGLEPLTASLGEFLAALRRERRTLKRALTDPRTFAGIGNAYSDEILHAARLSPLRLTSQLSDDEARALYEATHGTLSAWRDRLVERFATRFPSPRDVTAFRPEFAVHGKFGAPCPVCATAVQRIVRGEHETNYCPRCQTGGSLLADRSLSRLVKDDWPATIDEWEREGS
ncbi:MAG: DNA-formamidopyrimidine glycosylase family protein [Phycisphaerales bacterium]